MKQMSSLHQFFSEIACHFQCYNMGRRIYPIEQQAFIDFENTHASWEAPFLQHAWIALIFWENKSWGDKSWENKSWQENGKPDHHVWFLKLPLDEQAKLNLAARDDFLARLFTALRDYLTHSQKENAANAKHIDPSDRLYSLQSALQDNPYGFQPKDEQLANFHAIVHKQLSLSASSYYKSAQDYLAAGNGFENWHELGFQGFADIAARLDETYKNTSIQTNELLVNEAIAHLPMAAYHVLAACLENHPVSKQTTQIIYKRLITGLENNNNAFLPQLCLNSIRASSQSSDQQLQVQLLSAILNSAVKTDIEVLATISGRCWSLISHTKILADFLEALASADSQHPGAFNAILSDLMFIPGMRDTILPAFRCPDRSQQLTQAIGRFFSSL